MPADDAVWIAGSDKDGVSAVSGAFICVVTEAAIT
jgi:hypothetical protein